MIKTSQSPCSFRNYLSVWASIFKIKSPRILYKYHKLNPPKLELVEVFRRDSCKPTPTIKE